MSFLIWKSKLKSEGKSASETAELERLEKSIAGIIVEAKIANGTFDLLALESRVKNLEIELNAELKRLTPQPTLSDAEVQALLKKAEELALRGKTVIRALREKGRTVEAEGLDFEVQGLIVLDIMLRTAVTNEEISLLGMQLAQTEKTVEAQLSQLSV